MRARSTEAQNAPMVRFLPLAAMLLLACNAIVGTKDIDYVDEDTSRRPSRDGEEPDDPEREAGTPSEDPGPTEPEAGPDFTEPEGGTAPDAS